MSRTIARVASAVMVASSAGISAQGVVWTVDDDASTTPDFTDLQTAIDTVASGDVLLVKPGSYGGMDIVGKSLTVVADLGGDVAVGYSVARNRISGVPDGGSVRLRGLSLSAGYDALHILDSQGTVWVEDCRCDAAEPGSAGIFVQNCGSVVLINTTADGADGASCDSGGPGSGLKVWLGSSVHSYGCTFRGGGGGSYFDKGTYECYARTGGRGVSSEHSQNFLFFSGCSIRGGPGDECYDYSFGCTCGNGGTGLSASGSVYVLDSEVAGGPGRDDPDCSGGWDGPA
jgi:hypothetical protein